MTNAQFSLKVDLDTAPHTQLHFLLPVTLIYFSLWSWIAIHLGELHIWRNNGEFLKVMRSYEILVDYDPTLTSERVLGDPMYFLGGYFLLSFNLHRIKCSYFKCTFWCVLTTYTPLQLPSHSEYRLPVHLYSQPFPKGNHCSNFYYINLVLSVLKIHIQNIQQATFVSGFFCLR